jgi:hypothetical protein
MEFLIYDIHEKDGAYHVEGICSSESDPIKVGSQFSKVYKNMLELTPERNYEIVGREDVRDIKLLVNEIKAYRHSLDELPPGMSGEIILTGDKGVVLKKSETLGIS